MELRSTLGFITYFTSHCTSEYSHDGADFFPSLWLHRYRLLPQTNVIVIQSDGADILLPNRQDHVSEIVMTEYKTAHRTDNAFNQKNNLIPKYVHEYAFVFI